MVITDNAAAAIEATTANVKVLFIAIIRFWDMIISCSGKGHFSKKYSAEDQAKHGTASDTTKVEPPI